MKLCSCNEHDSGMMWNFYVLSMTLLVCQDEPTIRRKTKWKNGSGVRGGW